MISFWEFGCAWSCNIAELAPACYPELYAMLPVAPLSLASLCNSFRADGRHNLPHFASKYLRIINAEFLGISVVSTIWIHGVWRTANSGLTLCIARNRLTLLYSSNLSIECFANCTRHWMQAHCMGPDLINWISSKFSEKRISILQNNNKPKPGIDWLACDFTVSSVLLNGRTVYSLTKHRTKSAHAAYNR